jgi:hypothetical protein
VTQRLDTAQAQYDAADAAGDFRSIGALGKALEAVKAESDKIALTQKDYLTLADRHAALVQRVVDTCRELAKTGKHAEIATLAGKMDTLMALDLSALPASSKPTTLVQQLPDLMVFVFSDETPSTGSSPCACRG